MSKETKISVMSFSCVMDSSVARIKQTLLFSTRRVPLKMSLLLAKASHSCTKLAGMTFDLASFRAFLINNLEFPSCRVAFGNLQVQTEIYVLTVLHKCNNKKKNLFLLRKYYNHEYQVQCNEAIFHNLELFF